MNEDVDRPVLSRPLKVDEIKDGTSAEITANDAELEAMAKMLDLVALEGLRFAYRIDRQGGGRLRLTGTLRGLATQTCVITLDPVAATLDVPVCRPVFTQALAQHQCFRRRLRIFAQSDGADGSFGPSRVEPVHQSGTAGAARARVIDAEVGVLACKIILHQLELPRPQRLTDYFDLLHAVDAQPCFTRHP